jgi:hypothetical protein
MKTNFKNFAKVLLMAVTIFSMATLNSCSKPEDGKNGIDGATGQAGTNGTNGQTGTANVMYSNWLSQTFTTNLPRFKSFSVSDSRLTLQFSNNGGFVLGFFRPQANTSFILPYDNLNSAGYVGKRTFQPFFDGAFGSVVFSLISTSPTDLTALDVNPSVAPETPQYRYILIPGGVNISGRGISTPDYSKMSYQEICTKFNIPE